MGHFQRLTERYGVNTFASNLGATVTCQGNFCFQSLIQHLVESEKIVPLISSTGGSYHCLVSSSTPAKVAMGENTNILRLCTFVPGTFFAFFSCFGHLSATYLGLQRMFRVHLCVYARCLCTRSPLLLAPQLGISDIQHKTCSVSLQQPDCQPQILWKWLTMKGADFFFLLINWLLISFRVCVYPKTKLKHTKQAV